MAAEGKYPVSAKGVPQIDLPAGWEAITPTRFVFEDQVYGCHPRRTHAARVGIVVPYREDYTGKRKAQLDAFLKYYVESGFLAERRHRVYVVEQSADGRLFNRGALLNVGIQNAIREGCDTVITHDVDLLASASLEREYYHKPVKHVKHIAKLWDRYSGNPDYLGGIVSASSETWERVNGYPNTFWGWGGEDDALARRVRACGLEVVAPLDSGTIRDQEGLDLKAKLAVLRASRTKNMRKWEDLDADKKDDAWTRDGLNTIRHHVTAHTTTGITRHMWVDLAPAGK